MLPKELITRLEEFFKKIPPDDNYVEKYFRKLKSETELRIKEFKVLGIGNKVNTIVTDFNHNDEWYRCSIPFQSNKTTGLQIVNQSDPIDNYLNMW